MCARARARTLGLPRVDFQVDDSRTRGTEFRKSISTLEAAKESARCTISRVRPTRYRRDARRERERGYTARLGRMRISRNASHARVRDAIPRDIYPRRGRGGRSISERTNDCIIMIILIGTMECTRKLPCRPHPSPSPANGMQIRLVVVSILNRSRYSSTIASALLRHSSFEISWRASYSECYWSIGNVTISLNLPVGSPWLP